MSRCQSLPGGVGIQCRIPVPTVEAVIGPIPLGEWALKQIKTDLLADGHRVAFFFFFFFRLKNRNGEPSRAVRITFEGCTLPTEVWTACTPHRVSAFAGSVRRCTKCQVIGHTKSQCRSRVTRCSRCGAGGHAVEGCSNTLSCINCNGRHSAASGSAQRCWSTPGPTFSGAAATFHSLSRCRERGWTCSAARFYPSRPDSRTSNPSLTGAGLSTEPRSPLTP